jgi:fumarylpyruvate hydrolase
MTFIFPPKTSIGLFTVSGEKYPVGRVFCVGRNYEAHAREMGKDPERDPPFFFTKWPETVCNAAPEDRLVIPYPSETSNFHHEAELVVAIGKGGFRIDVQDALDHVFGYAVGLDMTRRDLQLEAREKGRPWDAGKNVEFSCPTGRLQPVVTSGHVDHGAIALTVNGEMRQSADVTDMIWSTPEIVSDLSRYYELLPGDLIYTGTPAGVGSVEPRDVISCRIAGLPSLEVGIGTRAHDV